MKKEFITVNDIKLAYLLKNQEKKQSIFFIHGNSSSSKTWIPQLNSTLLNGYRLIAIDLPGHGDSEASIHPENDYSIRGLGRILANAIQMLSMDNPYLLVGISLGTNFIAESLTFGLQPHGLLLGGSCIVGEKFSISSFALPNTHVHVVFTDTATDEDVKSYASEVMTNKQNIEEFISDYFIVSPTFRPLLSQSIEQGQYSDEIELMQRSGLPILVVFGKDEQIVNPDYLDEAPFVFWNDGVFKIPGANHLVHSDQPDVFNQLLGAYANDILK